jgi:hypothetical protein
LFLIFGVVRQNNLFIFLGLITELRVVPFSFLAVLPVLCTTKENLAQFFFLTIFKIPHSILLLSLINERWLLLIIVIALISGRVCFLSEEFFGFYFLRRICTLIQLRALRLVSSSLRIFLLVFYSRVSFIILGVYQFGGLEPILRILR